jgi:prephenate dehydrogenase
MQIVAAVGARAIWMEAAGHDAAIAATSHLPYLLSSALALATPAEAALLVGPGYRSTSRLAATPPSMMMGVLQSNRDNILQALGRYQTELARLTAALNEEDYGRLDELLAAARLHQQVLTNPPTA